MPMIADAVVRERALEVARSFIVQAPAGSGKTELLVQRLLKLLSITNKPEEVLAITFTRKAAAEMKLRVLKELPNAPDIAHRLRIQTIDAFCTALTRQTPVLARFGAQPQTVEDASGLYLEAAFQTLSQLENSSVQKLLSHLDNNVEATAGLLANMLARRDQWLRRTGNPPTRSEIEEALAFERKNLLDRAKRLDPRASEVFAKDVLTAKGEWRKRPKPAPPEIVGNEPLRLALAALLAMPPATYTDAQWEALEAILALLPLAAAQLKVVFAERGQADFTEIAQGAVRALGAADDPSELLLSLDQKISHVLVDEFQDTSLSQWELLDLLTANWNPEDGRTLFLVGDPMQSIYRFRQAEVALFLHARREGLGSVKLESLTLTTNFRSQEKLVAWFNDLFPGVFPPAEDESAGAVPYSPSTPNHPALQGEAAVWHLFAERAGEANEVARLAKDAQGTCAILVRNRSHLDEIVPALKAAGLRFRAIEIEQLGEKQVVQDLYALTRALMHSADRVAWLAILRAPWVGFSLDDLSLHFENKPAQTIWELIPDVPSLERFRSILGPALENRLRGTLRDRVEGCWLALGGPACVEDRTGLEDAAIYLDELERLEEAGDIEDPQALAEALEELYALPDLAADERLQIMTIHKAKGLEFDTVILPGLDRTPRAGEPPLFLWKELAGRSRFLFAPIQETGADENRAYDYLKNLERDAEDTEAGRLLYVAATRARQRIHLLGCVRLDEEGAPKSPNKRSLLAKVWPLDVPVTRSSTVSPVASPTIPAQLRRLPAAYRLPAPPEPVAWKAPPEGRDAEEQIEFSWAGETARHVGTVVHRWLQRIAEDELKGWDAERVESLRPNFERDLHRRGVNAPGPAADLIAAALKNTLADERGRWILGPHPEARSEYRLRTAARGFVIDRLLRDKEGRRWVVDFKTSRHEGANAEAFLDQERKRYAAQLDAYAAALGGASRGLYFPLHCGWREW